MSRAEARITRLEARADSLNDARSMDALIAERRFYDALSDDERQRYADYKHLDRAALEEVNALVLGSLHFELEPNHRPPTTAEMKAIIADVETIVRSI